MTELGKCPFCASSDVQHRQVSPLIYNDGRWVSEIICVCGARSGYFDDREDAIATWNAASEAVEGQRQ